MPDTTIPFRSPLTLDRTIKHLCGKLLLGTATKHEQAQLEHAQAERRARMLTLPANLKTQHQSRRSR